MIYFIQNTEISRKGTDEERVNKRILHLSDVHFHLKCKILLVRLFIWEKSWFSRYKYNFKFPYSNWKEKKKMNIIHGARGFRRVRETVIAGHNYSNAPSYTLYSFIKHEISKTPLVKLIIINKCMKKFIKSYSYAFGIKIRIMLLSK